MANYPQVLTYLDQFGFVDLLLPFAIFFSIVYAVLSKVKLFEEKRMRLVISLAVALLVVIPHVLDPGSYPGGVDPVKVVQEILPSGIAIILVLFLLIVLAGIFGGGTKVPSIVPGFAAIIALIAFLVVVIKALQPGFAPGYLDFLSDPVIQTIVVMLAVAGIVVYFVASEPLSTTATEEEKNKRKLVNRLREGFKGWLGE